MSLTLSSTIKTFSTRISKRALHKRKQHIPPLKLFTSLPHLQPPAPLHLPHPALLSVFDLIHLIPHDAQAPSPTHQPRSNVSILLPLILAA